MPKYCELKDNEKLMVQKNNAYKAFLKDLKKAEVKIEISYTLSAKGLINKVKGFPVEFTGSESKLKGEELMAYKYVILEAFKKYLTTHPLHQASYKVNEDGTIKIEMENGKQKLKDFYAPKDSKEINLETERRYSNNWDFSIEPKK